MPLKDPAADPLSDSNLWYTQRIVSPAAPPPGPSTPVPCALSLVGAQGGNGLIVETTDPDAIGLSVSNTGGIAAMAAQIWGFVQVFGRVTALGIESQSQTSDGVQGLNGQGCRFDLTTPNSGNWAAGVRADTDNGFGLVATSNTGIAIHAESNQSAAPTLEVINRAGGKSGYFQGDIDVLGTINVTQDIVLGGADCAEEFDVCPDTQADPGTVMILDDTGKICAAHGAYEKRVVGIVSGAGSFRPALTLNRRQDSDASRAPIALVGKVYCKAETSNGPISVGDLLTTSHSKGHAMRATDPHRAFGAVIGKALAPLLKGAGLIPVLVTLQ